MERIGRELSASQLDFIKIQHRKNQLAAVGKKRKRSTEEDAEFKKLQKKLNNSRRDMEDFDVRLLFKPPPKSNAERVAMRKEKRIQEVVEKERTNNAQGEAKRKAKRTQEVVEKVLNYANRLLLIWSLSKLLTRPGWPP